MLKRILIRFMNGFCCSVAVTLIIQAAALRATGNAPMLPEYMARFGDPLSAFSAQLLLIGVMSGVTSAGTAVFDAKKIGLMAQSVFFLLIMLAAWIPVACFLWGFHKYAASMIVTVCSIVVTYGICWAIQYMQCRREIEEINTKLSEIERTEE